jgi:C1A family cysteine protease
MRNTFWISFVIALLVSVILVVNFDQDKFMGAVYQSGLLMEKAEISEIEFQNAFMDFIATYQKSYLNSWEFENKYETFKDNYQRIADHNLNADMIGFTLKVNQFGDMSQEEFKAKYLTLKSPERSHRHGRKHRGHKKPRFDSFLAHDDDESDLPSRVDWREKNAVQKVKNQGSCGSCWAFSAVGAIESAVAIKTETLPNLSEQQLVDCAGSYGNEGCNGGFMDWAFNYAHDHAMCSETQYKYTGRDGKCLDADDVLCGEGVKVATFEDVTPNSKAALKAAVAQQPVSIGVCAESLGWQFYFGGIVRWSWLCGSCQDHGVLLVGYDNSNSKIFGNTEYWIIKNSWGTGWGSSGYIYVKADDSKSGVCGVLESPSYPIV